ncbi:hypothetical protein C4565_03185 [Candidatus Parcubacteria bacterium]|jgi:uncharacterized protein with PQ loop repeat|nr:MAG: hypothetical protein C4565_03185 [Candidatus Parcubacteria bacterium]
MNSFVEIQSFGLNLLTISFLGTVLLTLLQMKSMYEQGKTIWDKRNGESVSVLQFSYFAAYLFAIFPYGIAQQSIALIFNALLGMFCFYVMVGLWKYKHGVPWYEWTLSFSFFLMIPLMIFLDSDGREFLFSALLFGILLFSACQLYELVREGKAGNIAINVQKMFMASNTFWFFYSLLIGNIPLMIFNPIAFVINWQIIRLAKKYSRATV